MSKTNKMDQSAAELLAISALGFISSDPNLLQRFLALTGITLGDIRRAAEEPGFLAGVLQFIAAHEPTLMAFATATDIAPESLSEALRQLPIGDDRHERTT